MSWLVFLDEPGSYFKWVCTVGYIWMFWEKLIWFNSFREDQAERSEFLHTRSLLLMLHILLFTQIPYLNFALLGASLYRHQQLISAAPKKKKR